MARILLQQHGALRHLCSINVSHDGSIKLDLVRRGEGTAGWNWTVGGDVASTAEPREADERKTKSITIHTSGRINYKFDGHTNFAPCLMDLEGPVTVIGYSIPAVARLDEHTAPAPQDYIQIVPDSLIGRLSFRFDVLPAVNKLQDNEICRFGVEGLYALSCVAMQGDGALPAAEGVPEEVFTTVRPSALLAGQDIAEEVVFLRFKRAMYTRDVTDAVAAAARAGTKVDPAEVEAAIAAGLGLYPPNSEGVWTLITAVPMRIAPELKVEFADARYEAHVVDLRPGDTRLSTVRVRFKAFDKQFDAYEKKPVAIVRTILNAEI